MQGEVNSTARRGAAHALQAMRAIVLRELLKFSRQYGRLVSALVRPLLWLAVFAAGLRNVFGVAIVEPYDSYISYDVYIAPGLITSEQFIGTVIYNIRGEALPTAAAYSMVPIVVVIAYLLVARRLRAFESL